MRALAQLALLVVVSAVLPSALASNFTWTWPTTTAQCDTISMDIYGGIAPWTLFIIPVDGMPILWNLGATTDTANETVPATFTLPLALNASTDYVVYIEDSEPGNEYNVQGNPKEVQTVQSSGDDSCMSGVKIVEREFYFTVGGDSVPCGQMGIFYDDAVGRGPYSLTIIPLDGSFHPYDVSIGNTTSSTFYWGLQLEEGTRYTMMMSNYNGHGVGGVASIYSVGALPSGTTASCIAGLDFQPTGTWPSAVYTTAVGALTASVSTLGGSATSDTVAQSQTAITTSAPASSSSGSTGAGADSGSTGTGGKKSNAGVIGGAVGGVVGGLLILAAIGWFFFRRRKYQRVSAADGQPPRPTTGGRVDLGDDYAQAEEGDKVVPFPSPLPTSSQQQQQQQQPPMQQRESYGYNTSAYVLPTDQPGQQHPSQSHLYPSPTGDGAQNLGLATIPLGYSSPSQSQSLSQSQSQSQSQSGSSNAWGQSPTSPSAPGGVADTTHGGTRNSKMMQEYLRQTTFLPPGAAPTTSPPPGAVPGAAPAGAQLVSDVSGAGRGVPSPHSPPSSAGPWSHHDPMGQDDPEIILHQDGGAVPTHQQQEQVGQRERIELPPTYSQASGQQ